MVLGSGPPPQVHSGSTRELLAQCPGLTPRDFDLIGVGFNQHQICIPCVREQGTAHLADAM